MILNNSRLFRKLNRVTRILQTDRLLPRGSPCGLMTLSSNYSSSSSSAAAFACFVPLLHPSSFTSHSRTNYYYCSTTFDQPTMENYPKDTEEAIKDQQREGNGKSACDYDPSNRAFDDILPHLLNIYGSRGTAQDFEIYAPDATFEDPLMRSQGIKQIKSAFYSIPKVFSESRIVEYSVKEHVLSPGKKEILIDNKQYYKFLGKDINMISLIKLQLQDGKIVRHEDWWDKKPLWNRETVQLPLLGRITEMTRRASMLATHALMGFGKDPTM